ncbi:hypothetical protein ACS0TY_029673 [Phlomoides rotata]
MSADGTISEHSPQFVPLHQASGKSRNYQIGHWKHAEKVKEGGPSTKEKEATNRTCRRRFWLYAEENNQPTVEGPPRRKKGLSTKRSTAIHGKAGGDTP